MKVLNRAIQSAGEPSANDLWLKEENNNLSLKAHHNGEWKTVAGGGTSGGGADWNENDSSAPGYIANRPFYEEYGTDVIENARLYVSETGAAEQSFDEYMYVLGDVRYYFKFTPGGEEHPYVWTLPSADGDYTIELDPNNAVFIFSNSETGYTKTFSGSDVVPNPEFGGDPYINLGTDITIQGSIVHTIDKKFLPSTEQFIPIKVVHGYLNGKYFMQNSDEISVGEAIYFIVTVGGVVSFVARDGDNYVIGYSVGISNGIITFTDGYTWGGYF